MIGEVQTIVKLEAGGEAAIAAMDEYSRMEIGRKTVAKTYRRIHGFDMNTAAGRAAAKQYRMEKYRKKKGLLSGEPALPKRWWERALNENWEPGTQQKHPQLSVADRSSVDADGYRQGSCAEAHRATPAQVRRRIYSNCQHQKEDP